MEFCDEVRCIFPFDYQSCQSHCNSKVVEMLGVLQPGLSDMRGLVLYERASAKGLILQVG